MDKFLVHKLLINLLQTVSNRRNGRDISNYTQSGLAWKVSRCRLAHLTKQQSKYSAWTVPAVLAGFSYTKIACVGKMWIFIRSNIHILHI